MSDFTDTEANVNRDALLKAVAGVRAICKVAIAAFDAADAIRGLAGAPEPAQLRIMRELHLIGISMTDGAESMNEAELMALIPNLENLIESMTDQAEANVNINPSNSPKP